MSDLIGREILGGQYTVIERIGGGSFGEVFKVQKNSNGSYWAAKFEKIIPKVRNYIEFEVS